MTLDYGLIGNCKTSALVKSKGSIEWACFPRFDSKSVFCKILDEDIGGSFEIIIDDSYETKQEYLGNTNILKTVFYNENNEFLVIDYFPLYTKGGKLKQVNAIHRIVKKLKGEPKLKIKYDPKLDYARGKTVLKSVDKNHIVAENGDEKLFLYSNIDSRNILDRKEFNLASNLYFIISPEKIEINHSTSFIDMELKKTKSYWENYIKKRTIPISNEKIEKHIIRSILLLKLLTYHESGAIIAAPTTSLPEIVGSDRNWDYRYCWLRDASFSINAFTEVCSFSEAREFIKFLLRICKKCSLSGLDLQIMYGVGGETNLKEEILSHLKGYKNSKPVRIGNAAYSQLQIDVIGEVVDAIYHFAVVHKYIKVMTDEEFKLLKSLVNEVVRIWKEKDNSIWEFRDIKEHFTFSKLMSFVALDRGVKLVKHFNNKTCPIDSWKKTRDEIKKYILSNAWNEEKGTFTMFCGSKDLDASVLLMYHYGFIDPEDERYIKTVKAIEKELLVNSCFVYRYKMPDDFGEPVNTFTIASFWLIDSLYAIGEKEKAKVMFDKILNYSNHLNLFSEGLDMETKKLTGNSRRLIRILHSLIALFY